MYVTRDFYANLLHNALSMYDQSQVQRTAAMPLYHQIFLALKDEIVSGALAFGMPVPTEFQVSERYGVSRITARRAMQELSDQGFVERKRRIGTRVIYKRPQKQGSDPSRTLDSLIAFGRETAVELLEYGSVPVGADASVFGLEVDDLVLRALRLRTYEGQPLGVIESILPLSIAEFVTQQSLVEKPLLEILQEAGEAIVAGRQVISAVGAAPFIAGQLQLEPHAPVMRIERYLMTAEERLVGRTIATYRGDRYQLALDLEAVPHPLIG